MLNIQGKYNNAIVFANQLEKSATGQLTALCNQRFTEGSKIRIMPDAHAGAGCVIGTTMTVRDKIVPNLVGVDIGCGMETARLNVKRLDFQKLDTVIRERVPSGFASREKAHRFAEEIDLSQLRCAQILQLDKAYCSIGTLGGGNHFIEIDQNKETGEYYLIVHSGSRHAGLLVANYYQKLAGEGKDAETPFELAYLTGASFDDYVHDMAIMQEFAAINRKAIVDEIIKGMKWSVEDSFSTIHNYLDVSSLILRKGAVSAQKDEMLLIPMNMRDGSLLCKGKGNPDWNFSAPHGAGRIFSRSEGRNNLTLTQFKQEMKNVYSTCLTRKTIDESPMAYKPMGDIITQIGETVDIVATLTPVYNYKAGAE